MEWAGRFWRGHVRSVGIDRWPGRLRSPPSAAEHWALIACCCSLFRHAVPGRCRPHQQTEPPSPLPPTRADPPAINLWRRRRRARGAYSCVTGDLSAAWGHAVSGTMLSLETWCHTRTRARAERIRVLDLIDLMVARSTRFSISCQKEMWKMVPSRASVMLSLSLIYLQPITEEQLAAKLEQKYLYKRKRTELYSKRQG